MRLLVLLAACSGAAPPPTPPPLRPPPIDAGVDAAPDAGIYGEPWTFHFKSAQREELWTLRWTDDRAQIVVVGTTGTQRYWGTYKDGAVEVSTGTAKLALTCKPAQRPLSKKCNDAKAPKVDILECAVQGFEQPMPFGKDGGVEYVEEKGCKGFRLVSLGQQ